MVFKTQIIDVKIPDANAQDVVSAQNIGERALVINVTVRESLGKVVRSKNLPLKSAEAQASTISTPRQIP